jgi:hypothetical protein
VTRATRGSDPGAQAREKQLRLFGYRTSVGGARRRSGPMESASRQLEDKCASSRTRDSWQAGLSALDRLAAYNVALRLVGVRVYFGDMKPSPIFILVVLL